MHVALIFQFTDLSVCFWLVFMFMLVVVILLTLLYTINAADLEKSHHQRVSELQRLRSMCVFLFLLFTNFPHHRCLSVSNFSFSNVFSCPTSPLVIYYLVIDQRYIIRNFFVSSSSNSPTCLSVELIYSHIYF